MPSPPPKRHGSALHLAGSTTMMARMRRVAEAYMDEQRDTSIVIIDGGGTARGYKALLDRTADISMASAAAGEELHAKLARQQRTLVSTEVSTDAVAVLVHASNPVTNLSLHELGNILSGRIANWRTVGGADAPIHVLVGPAGGGVSHNFRQQALGEDATFTPARTMLGNVPRLRRAAEDPLAITYVAMMQLHDPRLKALSIDNVAPRAQRRAYPLHAPLLLAVADRPPRAATAFIGYAARQWNSDRFAGAGDE
jgi:phosphate transport system substrate-binding protein